MNHIKRSLEIDAWLKAQGITVEPDEFAPVVFKAAFAPDGMGVRAKEDIDTCFIVCPFYGPGGEGNSLKALRACCEKFGGGLYLKESGTWTHIDKDRYYFHRKAPPDGLALADLLRKIKEASE